MVDKNEIIEQLKKLNQIINEQIESLDFNNEIPQIELDLMLSRVREFYDIINVLDSSIKNHPAPEQKILLQTDDLIAKAEIKELALQPEDKKLDSNEDESLSSKTAQHTSVQPESLLSEFDIPIVENENIKTEEEVILKVKSTEFNSKTKEKSTSSITATLFDEAPSIKNNQEATTSLYDKITSETEDKSLATKHQKNPVSDLKASIGINEKFSFINELFDGDLNAYNSAIEKLNNSNDYNSATAFIESDLSSKYDWTKDSESLNKLKDLVNRRFTV